MAAFDYETAHTYVNPKTFIDAVTKSFGGDGPSNTTAYIASCIVTDEVPSGGYLLVIDNNKTQHISQWEEWLLATLKDLCSSKYELKEPGC